MKFNLKYYYALVWLSGSLASHSALASESMVKDSVGLTRDGSRTYVMYKVQPKQTLFSILKRYGSNINEFKAANPGTSENVQIGQVVRIPYKGFAAAPGAYFNNATTTANKTPGRTTTTATTTPAPTSVVPASQPALPKTVTHVVESGQNLYAIAAKYHIAVVDLRKWNNMASEHIEVGQVLVIDPEYAKKNPTSQPSTNTQPATTTNYQAPTTNPIASAPASSTPAPASTLSDADKTTIEVLRSAAGYKKTVETGYAELIDVEDKSGKYLGLHRSAPVGSLINVKNVANGQSIWVKIIGRLPDIGADKVIIKLSPRAFEKLVPADKKVRIELYYTSN